MPSQVLSTARDLESLRLNIFPDSWAGIQPAGDFPWHRYSNLPHSSQALAVDVFGWIRQLEPLRRDAALNSVAQRLGLERDSGWEVELEYQDPDNLLCERVHHGDREVSGVTTVDVLARSEKYLLCIECKFTEGPGRCSQLAQRDGLRQCSGEYRLQTNPRSGAQARCALSGKGIRYWELANELFGLDPGSDHSPCPFAGGWYQLLRNCALARELGRREGRRPVFALLYARGEKRGFKAARFATGTEPSDWSGFSAMLRTDALLASAVAWEDVLDALCVSCSGADDPAARMLRQWALLKIRCAGQLEDCRNAQATH